MQEWGRQGVGVRMGGGAGVREKHLTRHGGLTGHSLRGLVRQPRELPGPRVTSAPQAGEVIWFLLDRSSVWLPCCDQEINSLDHPGVCDSGRPTGGWPADDGRMAGAK